MNMDKLRAEYIHANDEVAEWLRRWTANPMCSARVGSNPILVGRHWILLSAACDLVNQRQYCIIKHECNILC